MWAGGGGRTLTRVVAFAEEGGPPSPVLRPVPNPRVGRAMHSSARPQGSASASRAQSERLKSQTVARTFFDGPAQVDEAHSAHFQHHKDMRSARGAPCVIKRAHFSR